MVKYQKIRKDIISQLNVYNLIPHMDCQTAKKVYCRLCELNPVAVLARTYNHATYEPVILTNSVLVWFQTSPCSEGGEIT